MIQEHSDESRQMGLNVNIAKTKVMVEDSTTINGVEKVKGYVYSRAYMLAKLFPQ